MASILPSKTPDRPRPSPAMAHPVQQSLQAVAPRRGKPQAKILSRSDPREHYYHCRFRHPNRRILSLTPFPPQPLPPMAAAASHNPRQARQRRPSPPTPGLAPEHPQHPIPTPQHTVHTSSVPPATTTPHRSGHEIFLRPARWTGARGCGKWGPDDGAGRARWVGRVWG